MLIKYMSLLPSLTHSLTASRLVLSTIIPLIVDQFGHSLRFCHLGFDKEAFIDGNRSVDVVILVKSQIGRSFNYMLSCLLICLNFRPQSHDKLTQ